MSNEKIKNEIAKYVITPGGEDRVIIPIYGLRIAVMLETGNIHIDAPIINYGYPINYQFSKREVKAIYKKVLKVLKENKFAPRPLTTVMPLEICENPRRLNRPMEMVSIDGYSDGFFKQIEITKENEKHNTFNKVAETSVPKKQFNMKSKSSNDNLKYRTTQNWTKTNFRNNKRNGK